MEFFPPAAGTGAPPHGSTPELPITVPNSRRAGVTRFCRSLSDRPCGWAGARTVRLMLTNRRPSSRLPSMCISVRVGVHHRSMRPSPTGTLRVEHSDTHRTTTLDAAARRIMGPLSTRTPVLAASFTRPSTHPTSPTARRTRSQSERSVWAGTTRLTRATIMKATRPAGITT